MKVQESGCGSRSFLQKPQPTRDNYWTLKVTLSATFA